MIPRLNDLMVRKLPRRQRAYFYPDPEMRQHGIRVQPTGAKSYVVICHDHGKQKWVTIGRVDLMTLGEARKKARGVIQRIRAGLPAKAPPEEQSPAVAAQQKFLSFIKHGIKPVCCLYRCYEPGGDLYYVGISLRPLTRQREHSETKPWWLEICLIVIEPFATREEALQAEKIATKTEYPKYNIIHNKRPPPIQELALLEDTAAPTERDVS